MTYPIENLPGLIIRAQSGFFTVQTDAGVYTCRLRGRLKRGAATCDIAAVGDRVQISAFVDGSGAIERVETRTAELARMLSGIKREYRQVILANPDQLLLVFACASPEPHLRMLDRFLVIAEKQRITPVIVANKVELIGSEAAEKLFAAYPPLGYRVIFTSAKLKIGIEQLREQLTGKISALTGPSGVGKSSLLNAIEPGLKLEINEVSAITTKGKHTTQVRQLFPLKCGGYVADTPGIRTLALWDTEPEELDGYFIEMRDFVSACTFNDCTHRNEPGCAVRQAVADGLIHPERYTSYMRLRYGDEMDDFQAHDDDDD